MGDRRLLGDLLVEAGLVRRDDVEEALEAQRVEGGRLCFHLMRMGKVTPGSLFVFLQEHFSVISPDLLEILREGPPLDLLPSDLLHFYHMVPLKKEGGSLLLALSNVDNPNLIPAVEELTGLKVDPLICPPCLIQESLANFFPNQEMKGVIRDPVGENLLVLSDDNLDIHPPSLDSLTDTHSPADCVRALLAEAIRLHCPEFLLEPMEEETRVTFRRSDGGETIRGLSPQNQSSVSHALQDISKLSIQGRTVPREGRFRLRKDDRKLSILVTSMPGFHGEGYRLRMLEERIGKRTFEEMLEDYPQARTALEIAIHDKPGVLLVVAPEGHYREQVLAQLVTSLRWKIGQTTFLTAPGAPAIPGVDSRDAWGPDVPPLAETLEAVKREQPDLLAVLQVQDREEMEALFDAASDRLVVAGHRSADAFEALRWLLRNGMSRYLRSDRLRGVLAVRMVERICEHCRRRYDLLEEFPNIASQLNGGGSYFANTGCRACRGAGILELEPAFEFLPGTPVLAEFLARSPTPEVIRREQTRSGVKTLFAAVMARAATGEVDVREPLRLLFYEGRGSA